MHWRSTQKIDTPAGLKTKTRHYMKYDKIPRSYIHLWQVTVYSFLELFQNIIHIYDICSIINKMSLTEIVRIFKIYIHSSWTEQRKIQNQNRNKNSNQNRNKNKYFLSVFIQLLHIYNLPSILNLYSCRIIFRLNFLKSFLTAIPHSKIIRNIIYMFIF